MKAGQNIRTSEADSVSNSVVLNGLQCTNELVVHNNEACDWSHNSQCESKVSHSSRSSKTACDRSRNSQCESTKVDTVAMGTV